MDIQQDIENTIPDSGQLAQAVSVKPAMHTFRLDLAYDGTEFIGWQRQASGRSVEGCLCDAIHTITQSNPTILVAGRTDTGVHAEHQVVRLKVETRLDAERLKAALNGVLPKDISVFRAESVSPEWNPRRDAIERTYYYAILNRRERSSLLWRRVYHARQPLSVDAMCEAVRHLIGRHDFTSFRSLHCDADHPIRTITHCEIHEDHPMIYLFVQGHAFLRNMVRIIAGTLVEIGRGERSPHDIPTILAARDRTHAGITLEAKGLTLARIRYAGDPPYTVRDLPRWIP